MFMKTRTLCREFDCGKDAMLRTVRNMYQNVKYRRYVIAPRRQGQPWLAMPEGVSRYLQNER